MALPSLITWHRCRNDNRAAGLDRYDCEQKQEQLQSEQEGWCCLQEAVRASSITKQQQVLNKIHPQDQYKGGFKSSRNQIEAIYRSDFDTNHQLSPGLFEQAGFWLKLVEFIGYFELIGLLSKIEVLKWLFQDLLHDCVTKARVDILSTKSWSFLVLIGSVQRRIVSTVLFGLFMDRISEHSCAKQTVLVWEPEALTCASLCMNVVKWMQPTRLESNSLKGILLTHPSSGTFVKYWMSHEEKQNAFLDFSHGHLSWVNKHPGG